MTNKAQAATKRLADALADLRPDSGSVAASNAAPRPIDVQDILAVMDYEFGEAQRHPKNLGITYDRVRPLLALATEMADCLRGFIAAGGPKYLDGLMAHARALVARIDGKAE